MASWGEFIAQQGLLPLILSFLPAKQKIQAALVCKQWKQQADAACVDIQLQLVNDTQWQGLQQWLPQHGQAVKSLDLMLQPQHSICQLQLPPKLQSLHLQGGNREAGLPWLPPMATACLTRLVLQQQVWGDSAPPYQPEQQLLLQEIRSLTSLQHFSLNPVSGGGPIGHVQILEAVSGLQDLTYLELHGIRRAQHHNQQQQQYLAQLTKLLQLDLEVPDTRCLLGVESLQSLTGLILGSHAAAALLSVSGDDGSSIGHLKELRSLTLRRCSLSTSVVSAISACPCLQQLDLSGTLLPRAAWQHTIETGRALRQLSSLKLPQLLAAEPLNADDVQAMAHCCSALTQLDGGVVLSVQLGLSSLTALMRLCVMQAPSAAQAASLATLTRLQELKLTSSMGRKWEKGDVQWLCHALQLTRLEIVQEALSDEAASIISGLVSLADLTVSGVTEQQLRSMTALTGLTSLCCEHSLLQKELELLYKLIDLQPKSRADRYMTHHQADPILIVNQAPVGAPPDVASQLARCFDQLEKIELLDEIFEDMEQQVCGVIQDSLKMSKVVYILQQERRQLRSQVGKLQQEDARLRQQLARMAARQQVLQAQQGGADAAE